MTDFTPTACPCGGTTRRSYIRGDSRRHVWRCTSCGCPVTDAPPPPTVHRRRKLGSFRFMELFADGRYVYAVQIHKGGVVLSGYAPGLPLPDVEELLLFREYPELVALVRFEDGQPVAMNHTECQQLVSGLAPQEVTLAVPEAR